MPTRLDFVAKPKTLVALLITVVLLQGLVFDRFLRPKKWVEKLLIVSQYHGKEHDYVKARIVFIAIVTFIPIIRG